MSCSLVYAINLKIVLQTSNELHWLDLKIGHQEMSSSNGHQGDMPYCRPIAIAYNYLKKFCKPCKPTMSWWFMEESIHLDSFTVHLHISKFLNTYHHKAQWKKSNKNRISFQSYFHGDDQFNSLWPSDSICLMVTRNLAQYWLRQWLFAWRHQAIPWPNIDISSMGFCSIHLGQ